MARGYGKRAALLLTVLAAACFRRAPPPDLDADPAALLAQVERTQARVAAVRGEARVRIESPAGSGTVTQLIAAARPDRVRLDTVDFFGNPASVLVAAGGRFALLDLREGVFLRGAATPENLSRLLPLSLEAEELVQLLCGAVPIVAGRPAEVRPGDGVLRLTIEGGDRVQRLEIGEGAAVHRSKVSPAGGRDSASPLEVTFDRFRPLAGRPFASEVRLEAPASHVRVRLAWKEVDANGVLPEGAFTLEPPPGVRIVDLDEGR